MKTLAIDQGTTSTRAVLFDPALTPVAAAQRPLAQSFPAAGRVEHDPEEIWAATLAVCREAIGQGAAAIGITNQRETTILWDRATGQPLAPAIVWQDRRTAAFCSMLAETGHEPLVRERTGLVIDPYFSASKVTWLLDHLSAHGAAERGEIAFGTVDSFLLWRLTGGRVHATDATNAARTGLYDIHRLRWDPDLLAIYRVPETMLPTVHSTAHRFGTTSLFGGEIPITAMAGDQQAALVGQACLQPGMVKSTYGTGCFMIANTGAPVASRTRLLTTIGWQADGVTEYALEGSIFVAGAVIQWLRDGLGLVRDAAETAALAASVPDSGGVHFVPALTGLGAPHWDPLARGLITGIERGTTRAHIVRAALEAVAFQTGELLKAMHADGMPAVVALRVDGGMVANDWFMQALADLTGVSVDRAAVAETTALGAAMLARHGAGIAGLAASAATRRSSGSFLPALGPGERAGRHAGWQDAVRRARSTLS